LKSRISKKRISLEDTNNFEFLLFGIICNKKDYRLCLELNKKLEIKLSKQDEYSVFNNKRMEDKLFSFYEYVTEENDRYNLIANKSTTGFLLPELKEIDYLFILNPNMLQPNPDELLNSLKQIPVVLGVYKLEADQLKSRDNLVF
jgi:hypothetical protein